MRTEPLYQPPSQRLDRTKLAALIDGRLAGPERDAALARLAVSPNDLEIVSDALAVAAEFDDDVADIRDAAARRAARKRPITKWLAIAAAIVVVASIPVVGRFTMNSGVDGYASLLTSRTTLREGWETHSWSATRGSSDAIAERVRGVRVGALTSTLDVAAARKDSSTSRIAAQIAALLDNVSGAGTVAASYRHIAEGAGAASPEQLRDARHEARKMVTPQAFDDGAWLEAARVAANDHDAGFFTARASRDQVKLLERDTANDPRTHADVKTVKDLVDQGSWNWELLANSTTNILAQLAAP